MAFVKYRHGELLALIISMTLVLCRSWYAYPLVSNANDRDGRMFYCQFEVGLCISILCVPLRSLWFRHSGSSALAVCSYCGDLMMGGSVDCGDDAPRSDGCRQRFGMTVPQTAEEYWDMFFELGMCRDAVRIKFEAPSKQWVALSGHQQLAMVQYALASCTGKWPRPGERFNIGDEVVVPLSPGLWVELCGACMRWCESRGVGCNLAVFSRSMW